MGVKYEVKGHVVEFDNDPSEQDIDEAASQLGRAQPQQSEPDSMADRSAKYGSITRTPTNTERIVKNLTSPETKPLGITGPMGLVASALGHKEEDVLPMVGQAVGGGLGGFLGATGGSMLGRTASEAVAPLRGKQIDPMNIAKEGLVTGAIEGLTRGSGKIFFRKQIADETLKGLGKQLGQMKDAMASNPELRAASQPILDTLETAYNSLPEPVRTGQASKTIRGWIKHLKANQEMSAKDLILMEEQLGNAADFGVYRKGVLQPAVEVSNPATNKIAKAGRSQVSDIVDQLAESGGQTGFGGISKKIAKMRARFPEIDPSKAYGSFGTRIVSSGLATAATGNPLVGGATYLGEKALQ